MYRPASPNPVVENPDGRGCGEADGERQQKQGESAAPPERHAAGMSVESRRRRNDAAPGTA